MSICCEFLVLFAGIYGFATHLHFIENYGNVSYYARVVTDKIILA